MAAKTKKSHKKGGSSKSKKVHPDEKVDATHSLIVDASVAASSKTKKGGKGSKSKKSKKKEEEEPPATESSGSDASQEEEEEDVKLTLEALDAMSDDDSNFDDDGSHDGEEEGGSDNSEEYSAEAQALRDMISDGKFDSLLKNAAAAAKNKSKKKKSDIKAKGGKGGGKIGDDEGGSGSEEELEDAGVEEVDVSEEELDQQQKGAADDNDGKSVESSDYDSEDDNAKQQQTQQRAKNVTTQDLALQTALQAADRNLPWAETFAVVAPTPLPFGPSDATTNKRRQLGAAGEDDEASDDDDEGGGYVDVHDDLKREVAFYDNALESVTLAREQCDEVGIPFARPDDFFAEMVKSDDHMAKIKDRLIFETKKMEAVERRKSNKEQTLMAKERHAHRLAEKARAKKAHMSAVDEWKRNAERNRGGLGGRVREDDEEHLRGMGGGGSNRKRAAADKRYGFGGKRGRFKQNDARTLNDMSGYNPRGGFGGIGQKGGAGGGGKSMRGGAGGGKKRPGKRARDASRGSR